MCVWCFSLLIAAAVMMQNLLLMYQIEDRIYSQCTKLKAEVHWRGRTIFSTFCWISTCVDFVASSVSVTQFQITTSDAWSKWLEYQSCKTTCIRMVVGSWLPKYGTQTLTGNTTEHNTGASFKAHGCLLICVQCVVFCVCVRVLSEVNSCLEGFAVAV